MGLLDDFAQVSEWFYIKLLKFKSKLIEDQEQRLKDLSIDCQTININEITPNWYAQNLVENKIITFENIEKKYSSSPRIISLSEELLSDILPTKLEKLFYFQTHTHDYKITTIVDTNVNEYIGPNLYLLNDKDTFFLAYVKESELKDNRMNVKPFLKTFHSFHIASKLLKISAKVLWQSSKIIYE